MLGLLPKDRRCPVGPAVAHLPRRVPSGRSRPGGLSGAGSGTRRPSLPHLRIVRGLLPAGAQGEGACPSRPRSIGLKEKKMRRAGRIFRGRPALAVLSVVLLFAGSRCAGLPSRTDGDSFLFPRLAERSWIAAKPARTFGPANLYEEIDGEAELFLPYAFRELTVAILTPAGDEAAE